MAATVEMKQNLDRGVAEGFGDEWTRFDQRSLSTEERIRIFNDYFDIFPFNELPADAVGTDIGCGSGRWAMLVAPRVGKLVCVDASPEALTVAERNCAHLENVTFAEASVDHLPIPDASLDFAYSLGVLHHVPDTLAAITSIVRKLKPGAPLLLYLYYALETQPLWYRALWHVSEVGRGAISRAPYSVRYLASQTLAILVYWPLARAAALAERFSLNAQPMPLSYYRDKSLYVMRTDALDRFGTRLEQRFSREDITEMVVRAGCEPPRFSTRPPYWVALTRRVTE